MKLQRNYILTLVAVITGLIVTACQKIEYPDPSPVATPANTSARVLFVNATNAPALTTLIENTPVGSALAPGATTAYLPIATNSSQIRIKGAGGVLGAANLDLTAKQTFLANTSYTVFVTDTISRPQIRNSVGNITDNGGIRFVTVTDNLTAPAAGSAHVRFLNLAADTSPTSLRLQPTDPTSTTVTPTFNGRAFRSPTVTIGTGTTAVTTNFANFTPIPAGTYVTQLYAAAAAPTALTATPATSTTLTVAAGKIYTVYAGGLRRTRTLNVGTVLHN